MNKEQESVRERWEKYKKDIEGRPYAGDPTLDFLLSEIDKVYNGAIKEALEIVGEDIKEDGVPVGMGGYYEKLHNVKVINQEKARLRTALNLLLK